MTVELIHVLELMPAAKCRGKTFAFVSHSFRNRLRNKSKLLKAGVNFLSVENDLILMLPSDNDGGIGQRFVFFGSGPI
ncbi:hypothetical protein [Burkholderia sp. GbtcB21]|uniref:hypothetical protein n=1 Tax=Burkholderia sp. GbtcB21 TaxID=2824766 RepID=UPI001C30B10A|nr:hypothetical protein [Burkholderia sp. GbtcB21]